MSETSQPTFAPAFADSPLKLIGRTHHTFHRIADHRLRDQGFAMGQLPVLVTLKDGRPRSQAELARLAQVEQPSMAQLLNRMERDGLVQRIPDPSDRRSRLITLTDSCVQRLHAARDVMQAIGQEALAGFSDEESSQLRALIGRVNDNLERLLADQQGL
ncbi:MAG: MarR family transcriptional regulator [Curvibacter sp.]|nr:MarR family transcriptional regulator [Curvibacter sp.]